MGFPSGSVSVAINLSPLTWAIGLWISAPALTSCPWIPSMSSMCQTAERTGRLTLSETATRQTTGH